MEQQKAAIANEYNKRANDLQTWYNGELEKLKTRYVPHPALQAHFAPGETIIFQDPKTGNQCSSHGKFIMFFKKEPRGESVFSFLAQSEKPTSLFGKPTEETPPTRSAHNMFGFNSTRSTFSFAEPKPAVPMSIDTSYDDLLLPFKREPIREYIVFTNGFVPVSDEVARCLIVNLQYYASNSNYTMTKALVENHQHAHK